MKQSVQESLFKSVKAFFIALNNLQLEYNFFSDNSVKATIQLLFGMSLLYKSDNKGKVTEEYLISNKKQKRDLKIL